MIPTLVALLGSFLVALAIERLRGRQSGAVERAGRAALVIFFVFTGASHFFLTEDMAQMVPPPFPPMASVRITGALEILGAVGLLIPATSRLAAWCLFALLVALFPANVYAAVNETGVGRHGEGPSYLLVRGPLQLLFFAWTWYFGIRR